MIWDRASIKVRLTIKSVYRCFDQSVISDVSRIVSSASPPNNEKDITEMLLISMYM